MILVNSSAFFSLLKTFLLKITQGHAILYILGGVAERRKKKKLHKKINAKFQIYQQHFESIDKSILLNLIATR